MHMLFSKGETKKIDSGIEYNFILILMKPFSYVTP